MGIQLTSVLQISVCTRQQILVMCRDEATVTAQKEPPGKIRVLMHNHFYLGISTVVIANSWTDLAVLLEIISVTI